MKSVLKVLLVLAVTIPVVSVTPLQAAQAVRTATVGYGASQYDAYQQAKQSAKDLAGGKTYREVSRSNRYDSARGLWVCSLTIEF